MSLLVDLPTELFLQVLSHLDNRDINTLLSIPLLKRHFDRFFCNVSDNDEGRVFRNVSKRLTPEDMMRHKKAKGEFLQALLEVHYKPSAGKAYEMIPDCFDAINISLFSNDNELTVGLWDSDLFSQISFLTTTPHITFEAVTNLTLRYLSIYPEKFHFPNVKRLTLESSNCISSRSEKLDLPCLETLNVTGTFESINACIDYKNTTLKTLELFDIGDMTGWSNVDCPSVRNIHVSADNSMCSFHNLSFENLEDILIDNAVSEFHDIYLPAAEGLHIYNSTCPTSIRSVHAPLVNSFSLWTVQLIELEDVNLGTLEKIRLQITQEGPDNGIQFFLRTPSMLENIEEAHIHNSHQILQHTRNLREMFIGIAQELPNETYVLPNLSSLTLLPTYGRRGNRVIDIRFIPSNIWARIINLTLMDPETLKDMNHIISSSELENLHLKFGLVNYGISPLTIPKIQSLTVDAGGMEYEVETSHATVKDCHFPDLQRFVSQNTSMFKPVNSSIFEFTAPRLQVLDIFGLVIDRLDLSGFPVLEGAAVSGGLRRLILGEKKKLMTLYLTDNPDLCSVEATGPLPMLQHFDCSGTPYFLDHDPLDTPLLTRQIEDDEVIYIENELAFMEI